MPFLITILCYFSIIKKLPTRPNTILKPPTKSRLANLNELIPNELRECRSAFRTRPFEIEGNSG